MCIFLLANGHSSPLMCIFFVSQHASILLLWWWCGLATTCHKRNPFKLLTSHFTFQASTIKVICFFPLSIHVTNVQIIFANNMPSYYYLSSCQLVVSFVVVGCFCYHGCNCNHVCGLKVLPLWGFLFQCCALWILIHSMVLISKVWSQ